ncbi:unnamed protein product [Mycena citricolor]|uniref:Alanine dehydrogenase/pyridine nucleotide transhydrogenase NAD(H)-binding domain-containing protein n=1 Tax=Mycena citricolor TaxID=2018698 RepID=A0AAD2HZQ6_9AGAR|nr:unnamed protein product [Mycena citricolor]
MCPHPFDVLAHRQRPDVQYRAAGQYLVGSNGKRTVGFGFFAGVAGVLESLSAMAHSHLEMGVASPFLYTPRPHTLPSLTRLRTSLRDIGGSIRKDGTPERLGPFIVGLTGTGNVAQGCLSMLKELPIQRVSVDALPELVSGDKHDLRKIYLVHATAQDYLRRLDGAPYDRSDYYANPGQYQSIFASNVAPYLTLFLNGVGWGPSFPRLMSNSDLASALTKAKAIGGCRFENIGDISCDPAGGLEFMPRSSTISEPFYKTRPSGLPDHLPDVQIMGVDILPATIPLDASFEFSRALFPYLESLIEQYQTGKAGKLESQLKGATIAQHGKLPEKHSWLQENLDTFLTSKASQDSPGALRRKKVLLLGSGMVAGPAVQKIKERTDIDLLIASNSSQEASALSDRFGVTSHILDLQDETKVASLISEADVVISLLPAPLHPAIAKECIKHRKHLVTASYISPEMKELHANAVEADVLLLNEIGLDPGIDHCSAISLVSKLQAEGKNVTSFTSFCGGLPAPDVPKVPLQYKFSWSPRGVLTAALNSATYMLRNQVTTVPGTDLLRSVFPRVPISDDLLLEGLPNRNSLPYSDTYQLGQPRTVLRGTLRYPGFSRLMELFRLAGFLRMDQTIELSSWRAFTSQCMALPRTESLPDRVDEADLTDMFAAAHWLGLADSSAGYGEWPSPDVALPAVPRGKHTPLDLFAFALSHSLRYLPGEQDMVVLLHEVIAQKPGMPEEIHRSSLVAYGNSQASAMAQTVGIPVAIAALNVLDGKVSLRGVAGPTEPVIYNAVLTGMEQVGLGMKEELFVGQTIEDCLIQA